MKPLKLVISAFGPYLGRTEIDFTQFGDKGIYLITGDTGAGKSTLFEAISYALYGTTVSGKDRDAEMLRNKSADDDTETFVELTFLSHGKEYRVYRSPNYLLEAKVKSRKKSGDDSSSSAKNREHKNVFELHCPFEGLRLTNEKEGTKKIESIIGIGKNNFKKISMIAQGEFMDVIRVETKEREKILTSVFNTEKYGRLTEKLKEYRDAARAEKDRLEQEMDANVRKTYCDSESKYYGDFTAIRSRGYISAENLRDHINILKLIDDEDRKTENTHKEKRDTLRKASSANQEKLTKAQGRIKTESDLKAKKAERERNEIRLPELKSEFEGLKDTPQKTEAIIKRVEVIRSSLGDYDEHEKILKELTHLKGTTAVKEKQLSAKAAEQERLSKTIDEYTKQTDSLAGIENKLTEINRSYDSVVQRGKELRELENRYGRYDESKADLNHKQNMFKEAEYEYNAARDRYENMNKEYLADMAGILARDDLAPGKPCPVCGSLEHPSPAKVHEKAPTKAIVESAKKKADDLQKKQYDRAAEASASRKEKEIAEKEICEKIRALFDKDISSEDIDGFRAEFDGHMTDCENKARTLKNQKKETEDKCEQKKKIEGFLRKLREEKEKLDQDITQLKVDTEANNTRIASLIQQSIQIKAKLEFASGNDARKEIDKLDSQEKLLKNKYESAKNRLEELEKKIAQLRSAEEVLEKQLDETEISDMDALGKEKIRITSEEEMLSKAEAELTSRRKLNGQALEYIEENIDGYEKAIKHYSRCEDLYRTAAGDLSGREKIKLDSYVLSAYFDRVLMRANKRLNMMTEGRYTFERSTEAADKRKATGLELNVLDLESTKSRSVNSLSGGESFLAALALSLGLSDEIQSESGGIRLETMYIDEGFGSLDGEHLDRAVNALTELSKGDCLIGIISHVEKLKELISRRIIISRDSANKTIAKVEI